MSIELFALASSGLALVAVVVMVTTRTVDTKEVPGEKQR